MFNDAHEAQQNALTSRVEKLYLDGVVLSHNIVLVHGGLSCASHGVRRRRRCLRRRDQVDQGTFTNARFTNYDNIACVCAIRSFLNAMVPLFRVR